MIRNFISLVAGFVLLCQSVTGQTVKAQPVRYVQPTGASIRPLTVGDVMPNFRLPEMMNYPSTSASINDFRAKLTILDFWSTSCSVCIAQFPHMQELKAKFGDQLQIILVNSMTSTWHDTKERISKLLERRKEHFGDVTLPISLNASALDSAFPAQTLPQEVWLDDRGKILGITGHKDVTEDAIKSILAGREVHLRLKKDVMIDLSRTSLQDWYYGSVDDSHKPVYGSILLKGFIDGLKTTGFRRPEGVTNRNILTGWYSANQPALNLILAAYSNIFSVPVNQVVLENVDTVEIFKEVKADATSYSHTYSYDITVPPTGYKDLMEYVRQDLRRAFRVSVDTATRILDCIEIEPSKSITPSMKDKYWFDEADKVRHIQNYPLSTIIDYLNEHSPIPIIVGPGVSYNTDFDMPANFNDVSVITSALTKAGIKYNIIRQQMKVVVIKGLK